MNAARSWILADLAATEALGRVLARCLRVGDAVLLEGDLGAGKTALARALLRSACGDAALEVPSPSFTLLQDYPTPMGIITHFDLWRIDPAGHAEAAIEELGWWDARAGFVLVEWPDRLGALRPVDALEIRLTPVGDRDGDGEARRVTCRGWDADRLAEIAP